MSSSGGDDMIPVDSLRTVVLQRESACTNTTTAYRKKRVRKFRKRSKKKLKNNDIIIEETKTTEVEATKIYCHTYSANTNSSERTRVGASASIYNGKVKSSKAKKNSRRRERKKLLKQQKQLISVEVPSHISQGWSDDHINSKSVVYDGGVDGNPPISPPTGMKWDEAVRIVDNPHLHIADSSFDKGLIYTKSGDSHPAFLKIPRDKALEFTELKSNGNSDKLCDALGLAIDVTAKSNTRGSKRETFSEYAVCNLGVKASRGCRGLSKDYQINKMPSKQYNCIVDHVSKCTSAFESIINTDVIRHTDKAIDLNGWELMKRTDGTVGSWIFPAINIAKQAFLRAHVDDDFTYSVVSVHIPDHLYINDDKILSYFVFPTLRIAVPLRPGDLLIFNPLVPHCLSSRCRSEDEVYTHSMYLKTAVVGLNDNEKQLTEEQSKLVNAT